MLRMNLSINKSKTGVHYCLKTRCKGQFYARSHIDITATLYPDVGCDRL